MNRLSLPRKTSAANGRGAGPRRPDPGGVLVPAVAAFGALSLVGWWWGLPTAIAAFAAGRGPGRARTVVLCLAGALVAGAAAVAVVPSLLALAPQFVAVVVLAVLVPWFVGRFSRQYQQLVRAGWERAEQMERERRLVAEQARLLERARIARDMHDVLGHDLSLIALSAGALKLAPGLDERHRRAAQDIRGRAAAAVERLGEVIGVLREEGEEPPRGPDDGDIARLVRDAAASGLPVELSVEGEPVELPPVVGRAAHRVVQEGLTNAAKHAPGAPVRVELTYTAAETRVAVRDEAGPAPSPSYACGPPPARGGRGLIGLDERVRLVGGTLDHGPRDGGFALTARLPRHAPAKPRRPSPRPGPDDRAPGPAPDGYRWARRRVRRTLLTALAVPFAVGAVLLAVVGTWETVAASRSVLDPRDYARLRVGQDRSDVGKVLPDRQAVERPAGAGAKERGTTCEFYAMTADRFDDRSGDVYRLCFRGGRLVSRDALTP
ncbi:sensor histidine kinase [Streptomyces californicus]|uniref:histidine kinase n=1 Tax=Streptomyces californicus TaxID=67351 RepID=A0ABD7CZ97_9ACTN|nr:sensor histidine kinase [Streptomyces californicus]QRV36587.1 sensor histidine kinase [Streptomyces californicus]QRV41148.1 sensor histidine kinase [Streptomyces californicus]QRV47904.1 sensor histidine kinase [Streptomyces californicus]